MCIRDRDADNRLDEEGLRQKIIGTAIDRYNARREQMGEEAAARLERHFMLMSLDRHWKEHLTQMDQLRKGIHLRSYAQKNPEQEYKRESFDLFRSMLGAIKSDTVQDLSRVHVPTKEELAALEEERRRQSEAMRMQFEHHEMGLLGEKDDTSQEHTPKQAPPRQTQRVTVNLGGVKTGTLTAPVIEPVSDTLVDDGNIDSLKDSDNITPPASRNTPCPCGSGLKYKQCHGKLG